MVTILDFEKIVAEIAPETGIQLSEVDAMGKREKRSEPVWVAEDSILLSQMIRTALTKAGIPTCACSKTAQSCGRRCRCKDGGGPTGQVSIVITDLEMPQMDGHNLTKRIKEDKELQAIPVIIFSS
ncbi:MAG: response regulator [Dysosmobacter welbionis]